jgi:hypothetical protein
MTGWGGWGVWSLWRSRVGYGIGVGELMGGCKMGELGGGRCEWRKC